MLSDRLQLIANMTPKCMVMADVGTDHGYLPINLVQMGKAEKAYAMDINKGPLKKANENISGADLKNEQVTTILSDGLTNLPADVEVVVIAGMGGMLIGNILKQQRLKLTAVQHLIVSPHKDEEGLRRQLHDLGWMVQEERMVKDNGKYYTVMHCVKGCESYSAIGYKYGQKLLDTRDDVWLSYMTQRLEKLEKISDGLKNNESLGAASRLKEILTEMTMIQEVLICECE